MKTTTRNRGVLLGFALLPFVSANVGAQPRDESRIEAGAAFAQTFGSTTFSATRTVRESVEDGSLSSSYKTKGASGGAFHVQYNFGAKFGVRAGAQFSSRTSDGTFTGQSPHPFFFNRPRTFSGSQNGLGFKESAFSLTAVMRGGSGKWSYAVEAGPVLFSVDATLATGARLTDTYPYDTATFASVTTAKSKASPVGIAAGLEFGRVLNDSVTAFVQGRYAGGSADVDVAGSPVTIKAGGVQARIGLKIVLAR